MADHQFAAPTGLGTATITATRTDDTSLTATCSVTVDYEFVDLGLPSGTLWATCNVGASSPEEYGDYFAWGETSGYNDGKTEFSWSTYKYCDGSYTTQNKYCTSSRYGTVDGKTELDKSDDAAYVNWGKGWRMPSYTQQTELRTKCTWSWTTMNGVKGYNVTGPSGNSIFLPAAGYRSGSDLYYAGSDGSYWTRTLGPDRSDCAYYLYFYKGYVGWNDGSRYDGQSVRAVRVE